MCRTKDKPCCTCFCGDGGCLASIREDFYMPATEELLNELANQRRNWRQLNDDKKNVR